MNKEYGVLLPVSSLPSNHGMGDFGKNAYKFIDWLKRNNYKIWQILPLNPLGPGYSPYMSTCSNALDFRYINLDLLVEEGLISRVPSFNKTSDRVDFYNVGIFKEKYLKIAFKNFIKNGGEAALKKFKTRNPWVYKYATFELFKKINHDVSWNNWEKEYIDWYDTHSTAPRTLIDDINFIIYLQYIALKQYKHLYSYAKKQNVKILSDMPFYVGFDSVECWSNRDQFMFDENNNQTLVGGVPPDAFSDDGQLWGSPIYNFEKMRENGYQLLVDRVGYLGSMCDYLRLDHFRAFDTYYVIPAGNTNARIGEWKVGPRDEFFNHLYKKYPDINLIAEDLGELFPTVLELRDRLDLSGMYIVQFNIFQMEQTSNNKLIVYSGTHDNETLYGWYLNMKDYEKKFLMQRFNCLEEDLFDNIFNFSYNSPSRMTIFPLQDLLKLDNSARMNVPGTVGYPNFTWKLVDFSFADNIVYPKKWMIR